MRKYYARGCLLDYHCFKDHYKVKITIDLSKQKTLHDQLKAVQQNIFTGKLNTNAAIFFILEEVKNSFDIKIK